MASGHEEAGAIHRGENPAVGMGILFVGDKGMLLADYSGHVLLPEDKFKDFQAPAPFIPKSPVISRNGSSRARRAAQRDRISTTRRS
jgi:hypothetical protein